MSALLSTAEAAEWARVRLTTIWQWKHRGLLLPAGRDERGRPLYDVADVVAVERATRRSGKSRRRVLDPP